MEDLVLVRDLGIVWLSALIAGFICIRVKQPTLLGYILAGLIIGPHCLKLIGQQEQVKTLAELGVALLLFVLGVEASLKEIFHSAKNVILAGFAQLIGTAALAGLIAFAFHVVKDAPSAFLFGWLCALSSTVVVTKTLTDRGESDSAHGHLILAILILQDISLVPVISFLPIFSGDSQENSISLLMVALIKAVSLILIVVISATKVVPPILKYVARTNSREIFVLTVMTLCLGIAFTSKELGLSLALGAFLGGIMISESPYGHQALSDLFPVKELFATVFFVSVGLLLDPFFVYHHPLEVSLFVLLLIVCKTLIGYLAARFATKSQWTAALVGTGLAQIGEFSFVLATLGYGMNLLDQSAYNLFFAGAVISIIACPTLMSLVPRLLRHVSINQDIEALKGNSENDNDLRNHVIICGYGRIGSQVGNALKRLKVPFVVIDLRGDIMEESAQQGIRFVYGDAFSHTVLNKAGLTNAAALVITLPDPVAALTTIGFARRLCPELAIIARAHRSSDIEFFRSMGASAVVQPEFESSKEITRLALLGLKADQKQIQLAHKAIEQERYKLFRHDLEEEKSGLELTFAPTEQLLGNWLIINKQLSKLGKDSQKTIETLDIRKETGTTILAIRRGNEMIAHPKPDEQILPLDQIYAAGEPYQLKSLSALVGAYEFCPVIEEIDDEQVTMN
jgi:CPA2 family monovalent cation:H+ antiporter-2